MKKLTMAVFAVVFAGSFFVAAARAGDAGQGQTFTGEVLDLACYLSHGASGSGHAMCARGCLAGGVPAGLLTDDGKVYLLVPDHMNKQHQAAFNGLKKLAGKKATITGGASAKGGLQALIVESVK